MRNTCFACQRRRSRLVDGLSAGRILLDHFSQRCCAAVFISRTCRFATRCSSTALSSRARWQRQAVTCFDCHRPHEGTVKAAGNGPMHAVSRRNCAGTRCRQRPERRVRYAGPHASSARLGWRSLRQLSHAGANLHEGGSATRPFLRHPRPDLSALYGTPNACTSCHEGQNERLGVREPGQVWYGKAWRQRPSVAHAFAELRRTIWQR